MAWITENWFWVLIFVVFLAMHLVGHGGHGGHGSQGRHGEDRKRSGSEPQARGEQANDPNATSGGHRH